MRWLRILLWISNSVRAIMILRAVCGWWGGGIAHAYDGGLFQTAVGQSLNIYLSDNATVGGYVVYREV
jgi:hypothetical protein